MACENTSQALGRNPRSWFMDLNFAQAAFCDGDVNKVIDVKRALR